MRPLVRRLLVALAVLLLATLAGLAWATVRALSTEATVRDTELLSPADVERALRLARQHDPRQAIPGVQRTLRLTQHEVNLLLNHAATRVRPSRWDMALDARQLRLRGSVPLPPYPFDDRLGHWLNLELKARQVNDLPELESMRIGQLSLPLPLVRWAFDLLAARVGLGDWQSAGVVAVHRVWMLPRRVDLTYAWGEDAAVRVVAALVPAQEHERLRLYAEQLLQWAASQPGPADGPRSWPLSQLMPPLFELARQRSALGQEAALENRAALLVLGMVANGVSLATLLPERRDELARRPLRTTLAGRGDSPQHFLISATLAAEQGTPLADLVGLYKEIADSRGGTGFSFNDMAANRAGTRLGALAVADPQRLQQRLASGLQDLDILPDVSDLPESMNEAEFRRRFGGPGAPAYRRMIDEIDGRLDATPLFR